MWSQRLADAGVAVHAMHPGWVDTPGVRTSSPVQGADAPGDQDAGAGRGHVGVVPATGRTMPWSRGFWHDRRLDRPLLATNTETQADRDRSWPGATTPSRAASSGPATALRR